MLKIMLWVFGQMMRVGSGLFIINWDLIFNCEFVIYLSSCLYHYLIVLNNVFVYFWYFLRRLFVLFKIMCYI